MDRRTFIKGAAWSVPVVAVAVAVPAVAASELEVVATCGGSRNDNGTYTVQGNRLTINYRTAPDIYEVNARGGGWSKSYGTNYGTAPVKGSTVWEVVLPFPPAWVQVHSMGAHYGEPSCPA